MTLIKCYPKGRAKTTVPNLFNQLFSDDFLNLDTFFEKGLNLNHKGGTVNISESEKDFGIDVALPGFAKEDFSINVEKDLLKITAERKVETTEENAERKYVRQEFGFSKFSRSFHLPESVDTSNINAAYNNGILTLTLPKLEKEVEKVKSIEIS